MNLPLLAPLIFKAFSVDAASEIKEASVVHTEKGLVVVLRIGADRKVLAQYRGGPRFFKTFDAAASMLKSHGIESWTANSAGWLPKARLLKMNST